jgi:hypothetical protein
MKTEYRAQDIAHAAVAVLALAGLFAILRAPAVTTATFLQSRMLGMHLALDPGFPSSSPQAPSPTNCGPSCARAGARKSLKSRTPWKTWPRRWRVCCRKGSACKRSRHRLSRRAC